MNEEKQILNDKLIFSNKGILIKLFILRKNTINEIMNKELAGEYNKIITWLVGIFTSDLIDCRTILLGNSILHILGTLKKSLFQPCKLSKFLHRPKDNRSNLQNLPFSHGF